MYSTCLSTFSRFNRLQLRCFAEYNYRLSNTNALLWEFIFFICICINHWLTHLRTCHTIGELWHVCLLHHLNTLTLHTYLLCIHNSDNRVDLPVVLLFPLLCLPLLTVIMCSSINCSIINQLKSVNIQYWKVWIFLEFHSVARAHILETS